MFSWINGKRFNLNRESDIYYYRSGEIFEDEAFNNIEKLYGVLKNKKFSLFKEFKGEYSFFIEDEDNIFIFSDEIGTIKWYYFYNQSNFIVSNNFWEIVKVIKPSINDINKSAVFEYILMNKSLNEESFIKGIKQTKGGELLIYNKKNRTLEFLKINEIYYIPNKISEYEAIENIDRLLKLTVNKIFKFNNDSKVGITISGGLDSRFPVPYLKDKNVVISYLIGKKNNFFKPLDYESAKRIADLYGFKFEIIDPFIIDIYEKSLIDILRNPTPNSNIMKAINYEKVFNNFDILITGAYGGLIGGRVLNDNLLNAKNIEKLTYYMFDSYSLYKLFDIYENNLYFREKYLNKLYNFLGIKVEDSTINRIDSFLSSNFLIDKNYKNDIFDKLRLYLTNEKNKVNNSLSLIMRFHLSFHSIRGAFESLHGQVKSYSIYNPYIYHFSKSWPIEFLKSRTIMEKFLLKKHKELAKIPLQTFDLPIFYKYKDINSATKILLELFYLSKFLLKRLAINYTTWWNYPQMIEFRKKIFNKDSYFYEIFNKKDVEKINNSKFYTHLANNLLKTKLLIDLIESKEYLNLNDSFRFSKKY